MVGWNRFQIRMPKVSVYLSFLFPIVRTQRIQYVYRWTLTGALHFEYERSRRSRTMDTVLFRCLHCVGDVFQPPLAILRSHPLQYVDYLWILPLSSLTQSRCDLHICSVRSLLGYWAWRRKGPINAKESRESLWIQHENISNIWCPALARCSRHPSAVMFNLPWITTYKYSTTATGRYSYVHTNIWPEA
jgi:hypothetical protein